MKTRTALLKAANFLQENEWNQVDFALDVEGNRTEVEAGDAYSYCVLGAIWAVSDEETMFRCVTKITNSNKKLLRIPDTELKSEPEDLVEFIGSYNDRKNQTKGNMIRFLKNTAKKVKK